MAPPKKNQLWKRRKKHGRDPIYATAEELWNACVEYFEWCENNPLKEEKVFHNQGEITRTTINKMRAMTLGGMCVFIGISKATWASYKNRGDDFLCIINMVEEIIRENKFTGAAADLLNANIIARDLGLSDKTKTELTGKDGGPIETRTLNDFYSDVGGT